MRIALARALPVLLCMELPESEQAAPVAADVAPAVIVRFPSAALGSEQVATVLLPPEYSESRTRHPVLYLLHGGGQDHTAFATRSWFAAQRVRGMIIVTPGAGDGTSPADRRTCSSTQVSHSPLSSTSCKYTR